MWDNLEESGRLLVQACAMSYGYGFTPEALRDVHEMIRDGVGLVHKYPSWS